MPDRPFAIVTAPTRRSEAGIERATLDEGYLQGLRVAGLLPLIVSPAHDEATRASLLDRAGGMLLTGGEDVHPARYGEEMNGSRRVSPARDAMEFGLVELALDRGLPVLAICRGMQVLNVALGGSLHQDLASEMEGALAHDRWKDVDGSIHAIRPDGPDRLTGVFDGGPTIQNSAHHQGVDRLAAGLTAVGYAPDGLVEAVEYRATGAAWTVGVQWHPERKIDRDDGVNRRLFERFGDEVRGRRDRNGRSVG